MNRRNLIAKGGLALIVAPFVHPFEDTEAHSKNESHFFSNSEEKLSRLPTNRDLGALSMEEIRELEYIKYPPYYNEDGFKFELKVIDDQDRFSYFGEYDEYKFTAYSPSGEHIVSMWMPVPEEYVRDAYDAFIMTIEQVAVEGDISTYTNRFFTNQRTIIDLRKGLDRP